MKWILQFFCAAPWLSHVLCGNDEGSGQLKKHKWYRPKNDRSGTPIDAYHPDIPDVIETTQFPDEFLNTFAARETGSLKSSKSQYLPKSVYTSSPPSVPILEKSNIVDKQQERPVTPANPFRLSPPHIPVALPDRTDRNDISFSKTNPHVKQKSVQLDREETKAPQMYDAQNFEWKYTTLLIDQLFDHLVSREEDHKTCVLIMQEKNHLLRLVNYKEPQL